MNAYRLPRLVIKHFACILLALTCASAISANVTKKPPRALPNSMLKPSFDSALPLISYAGRMEITEAANQALQLQVKQLQNQANTANQTFLVEQKQREAFLAKGMQEDQVNLELFKRQLFYHPLILATVLILVLSSTLLVVLQFWKWNKENSAHESSLELGKDGLKVKSPFIGLLMLVASYAFFYLYILEVYRIHPLVAEEKQATTKDTAK